MIPKDENDIFNVAENIFDTVDDVLDELMTVSEPSDVHSRERIREHTHGHDSCRRGR